MISWQEIYTPENKVHLEDIRGKNVQKKLIIIRTNYSMIVLSVATSIMLVQLTIGLFKNQDF